MSRKFYLQHRPFKGDVNGDYRQPASIRYEATEPADKRLPFDFGVDVIITTGKGADQQETRRRRSTWLRSWRCSRRWGSTSPTPR